MEAQKPETCLNLENLKNKPMQRRKLGNQLNAVKETH